MSMRSSLLYFILLVSTRAYPSDLGSVDRRSLFGNALDARDAFTSDDIPRFVERSEYIISQREARDEDTPFVRSPRDANALYGDDGTARLSRRRLADLENFLFALDKRDRTERKTKKGTKSSSSSAAPASAPPAPASGSPSGQAIATGSPKTSSPSSSPTPTPTNQPSSQEPSHHRDWIGSAGSGLSVVSQFSEMLPKSSDSSIATPTDSPSPPSNPSGGGTTDPSSQPLSQNPPSSPGAGPLSLIPPTPKERRAALYDSTTGYPPLPARRPGYPQLKRRTPRYSSIPAAADYILARRQAQLARRRGGRSGAGKSPGRSDGGGSGKGVGDVLNGMNTGMDIANTLLGGKKSSGGGSGGGGGDWDWDMDSDSGSGVDKQAKKEEKARKKAEKAREKAARQR